MNDEQAPVGNDWGLLRWTGRQIAYAAFWATIWYWGDQWHHEHDVASCGLLWRVWYAGSSWGGKHPFRHWNGKNYQRWKRPRRGRHGWGEAGRRVPVRSMKKTSSPTRACQHWRAFFVAKAGRRPADAEQPLWGDRMNQQVNDGQIVFDAARLYAGIAYHLRQTHAKLKYADYTRDSMVGLGLRLARQKATATCSRWDWARKTDWQRLCWLMRITGTTVKPLGKTGTAEVVPE